MSFFLHGHISSQVFCSFLLYREWYHCLNIGFFLYPWKFRSSTSPNKTSEAVVALHRFGWTSGLYADLLMTLSSGIFQCHLLSFFPYFLSLHYFCLRTLFVCVLSLPCTLPVVAQSRPRGKQEASDCPHSFLCHKRLASPHTAPRMTSLAEPALMCSCFLSPLLLRCYSTFIC